MSHPQSRKAKEAKRRRAEERRRRSAEETRQRAERQHATQNRRSSVRNLRRRRRRLVSGLSWAAVVAVVAGIGWAVWIEVRPGPELAGVERPRDAGSGHVDNATYASPTPTSGAHDTRAPACGVYPTALDRGLAVHALEHGTVVLWYDASRPELGGALAAVARGQDSHVIVSPSLGLDHPVVATAWNRRKGYDDVVPEVEEFVNTYRRRGPESVPCDLN